MTFLAAAHNPADAAVIKLSLVNLNLANSGTLNGYIYYDQGLQTIGAFDIAVTGFSTPLTLSSTNVGASASVQFSSGLGGTYIDIENPATFLVLATIGAIPSSFTNGQTIGINASFSAAAERFNALSSIMAGQTLVLSVPVVEAVPEPASLALLGAGLFGLRLIRRRKPAVIS